MSNFSPYKLQRVFLSLATIVLFSAGIFLAGCKKVDTIESNKINIGGHTTQLGASIEIAQQKGLYEKYGLEATIRRVDSSKESMAAMEAGSLDVVIGSLAAGSFNLTLKGDLVIIADGSRVVPSVIIRKDLWDSGIIKTLADLKGRTIMTPREGSSSSYALSKILRGLALTLDDIKPKYLEDNAALAALEAKQIDAAILNEPHATNAVDKGLGIRFDIKEIERFFPVNGQQHMVIYTRRKILEKKPEMLRKFLAAYVKAAQFYVRAWAGNQPDRSEAIKIIAQYTGADTTIIDKSIWPYVSPDGKPDISYIKEMHDYFVQQKLIDKPLDFAKVIHLELLPKGK